ncbi:hypothetical protein HMPREF9630_02053 [Peptoanaerobacter stomatis]|uniref:NAD-dependent malic enzyme n=1 Tax=Peptoanaerobacter stomatis TaxID=796937 RepID=V9HUH3_9FIRM|nr:NADP-dependent malic enzyme [Peptoanaerobacter stomatis]EHL15655.1 hypothetical protein HMPREF9630_02053 [Peptoanaerobacter stomatis]
MVNFEEEALKLHKQNKGKIGIKSKININSKEVFSLAHTPGVAFACKEIQKNPDSIYEYTAKGNLVAVVTDGSSILGLGNIGSKAGMPVMEGKAMLMKEFADVDAFPICLNTQDTEEIISAIKNISPTFGAIHLEDIAAPKCIEIEKRLSDELNIPVFHDDRDGAGIVVSAALLNALKLVNKPIEKVKICINGAGAAGYGVLNMLMLLGAKNIIVCDRKGIIYKNRENDNLFKQEIADITNKDLITGNLKDAVNNADIFIGVSSSNLLDESMIRSMNEKSIVFAMANPVPEIYPDVAKKYGAFIVGSGRSDYENQINNILAFPGVFRGLLDARAKKITDSMKLAAINAIAESISDSELNPSYIIPSALDRRIAPLVSKAVFDAYKKEFNINKESDIYEI